MRRSPVFPLLETGLWSLPPWQHPTTDFLGPLMHHFLQRWFRGAIVCKNKTLEIGKEYYTFSCYINSICNPPYEHSPTKTVFFKKAGSVFKSRCPIHSILCMFVPIPVSLNGYLWSWFHDNKDVYIHALKEGLML